MTESPLCNFTWILNMKPPRVFGLFRDSEVGSEPLVPADLPWPFSRIGGRIITGRVWRFALGNMARYRDRTSHHAVTSKKVRLLVGLVTVYGEIFKILTKRTKNRDYRDIP